MDKREITLDDLGVMIADGFAHTATKESVERLEKKVDQLEQGQEDIKLRLDNVAYRFELVELQKRVERLEVKIGK